MEPSQQIFDSATARAWAAACPAYRATPLLRQRFDGRPVWLKDETRRMGLGAFKALGGVYAVGRIIAREVGGDIAPSALLSEESRRAAARLTFVTASAGNHGMAVAAGAQLFGAAARIHLARSVPEAFAVRLRAKGAEVRYSGATYEESIAGAIADAESSGAVHLTDTSWPGYTETARLVMEGYTLLAEELRREFAGGGTWPSRVYLQAGVGGLAGAIAWSIRHTWEKQPRIIVVEPDRAPCLRDSIAAGTLLTVAGPISNMGRLDSKTPSLLAFEILRDAADQCVVVSDEEAAAAAGCLSELQVPQAGPGIRSTPSGAAGLAACLREADAAPALIILTEGDPAYERS